MQKLDLGVDYDPENQAAEPVTAEPVITGGKTKTKVVTTQTIAQTTRPVVTKSATTQYQPTNSMKMKKTSSTLAIIISVIAIIAGSATGVGAYKLQTKNKAALGLSGGPIQQVAGNNIKNGDVFGSADETSFKDSAEGYLKIGGFSGEGSHHLLRPGGDNQTVYMVSSSTDLDKFDGMDVKVWGETNKGEKVGWLMDVGRVQVVNTQGTPPADATKDTKSEQGD